MKQDRWIKLFISLMSVFKTIRSPAQEKNMAEETVKIKPNKIVSDLHLNENHKKSEIKMKKEDVNFLPTFKINVANYANDENTKKVRAIINDEFRGGFNGWDLQCTEYVQYRIQQVGLAIKWPVKNNRNGGNWAVIFQTHGPYKVSDKPKQHCAISFPPTANNPFGHVAFVEEVDQNNGSISISEANWPKSGIYKTRLLSKSQWSDQYRARFIDFSALVLGGSDAVADDLILGGVCDFERNTIFLAYSDEDKDLARQIKFGLKKEFDIFLAREDLVLSNKWPERIKNEIKCRRLFIALMTENYFSSVIAGQESGIAIGLDKNIIPLFIGVDPKDTGLLYETHGFVFETQKTMEENCIELSKKLLLVD